MRPTVGYLLLGLLLLSNVLWLYNTYGAAADLDGQRSALQQEARSVGVLSALLTEVREPSTPTTLIQWAQSRHPEWVSKRSAQDVEIEGIRFRFQMDSLVGVAGL